MTTYEITYLAHTNRLPERIEAASHTLDDSTTPSTHRFQVRGRIMSSRPVERTDVERVREIHPAPAGNDRPSASPLPPFARQVSNRAFPKGRSPGADR
jgi:hypothetical protein